MTNEDIPSLTLRVLENIQLELVGLRGDVNGVKGELVGIKGELVEMKADLVGIKGELVDVKGELRVLSNRFDHPLGLAGKDVQDLKVRVAAVEQHLGLTPSR